MGLLSTLGGLAGNFFFPGIGGAVGGALGGLFEESSGGGASGAASEANAATQQATDKSLALQREMFQAQEARYAQQQAQQEPWRQAGVNALARMQGSEFAQPSAFTFGPGAYQADPGYAFRLSEGQKALDRQAAARGGLISGGALKAATRYGQEMGSQEYSNAYNRALTGYNANVARSDTGYNRLAGLAGVGQAATNQIGAAGQALGAAGQSYATGAGQQMYQQGVNTGNALIAGQQARQSAYGDVGDAARKYLTGGSFSNPFSSGSQTPYYGASGTSGGYQ